MAPAAVRLYALCVPSATQEEKNIYHERIFITMGKLQTEGDAKSYCELPVQIDGVN